MSSLSRSLSLPPCLKLKTSELEDQLLTRFPPSRFQTGDVASGKDVIEHPFHKHPLILSTYVKENVDQNDLCLLCRMYFTWGTPIYSCSECDYYFLHKWSAGLPKRITNLLHPEHHLRLGNINDYDCCKCGEKISGCGYECIVCDFYQNRFKLHVKCGLQDIPVSIESTGTSSLSRSLSFPFDSKQNSPIRFSDPRKLQNVSLIISSFPKFQINANIRHFSHKHPLVLVKYFKDYEWGKNPHERICILCGMELLPDVLSYSCAECIFFIHESCSKNLPQKMRTTLHPAHLLELTSLKTKTVTCICAKEISGGIGYYCGLCDFALHYECASTHNFEDHKEHYFHYFKATMFTCDACGVTEKKECISFVCTGCHLQVHKKCLYYFPRTVKQRRHHHKLRLTYFFGSTDDDFANRMCMICFNKINNVYCMYQCTKCAYITHATCSASIATTSEDTEEQQQVTFFNHYLHDLVFITNLISSGTDEICDACVRPIICVPFFKCVKDGCSFRLHKQCFELPSEIQHPLHAHTLKLVSPCDLEYSFLKLFMVKCYGCDIRCNGFVYACLHCEFWMDVRCSLLSDTLKHDSHDCTLSLVDYKYVHDKDIVDKAKCSACESHSLCKYTCERCNFHLDLGCALLPKTVPHECPRHNWKPNCPLKLMYGAIKDASGIYFCDLCEEPRGEEDWFYYCEDCKWSNHPHCVLGKVQLKYGKTYLVEYRGKTYHEVKLVKEPERGSSCDHCGKPCEIQIDVDNARLICENPQLCSEFFCDQCKIHIHVDCAWLTREGHNWRGIFEIVHINDISLPLQKAY